MTLITHMGEIIQYLFFHDWFIALSMAKFAQAVALVKLPFLREAEYHPTVCTDHIWLSICLFVSSETAFALTFGGWERCHCEHGCTNISLSPCFQFWSFDLLPLVIFDQLPHAIAHIFFFTGEYGGSHSRQISLPVGSNHQKPCQFCFPSRHVE